MKKYLSLIILVIVGFGFIACSTDTGPKKSKISKVYEVSYPDGISIFISNMKIRKNIEISDARVSFGQNKREVQYIINNNSNNIYNLVVDSQWSDDRGIKISSYSRYKKITIGPKDSKMIIAKAPNFKAKNVMIKVNCDSSCIEK